MVEFITSENAKYIIYAKVLFLIVLYTFACIKATQGEK